MKKLNKNLEQLTRQIIKKDSWLSESSFNYVYGVLEDYKKALLKGNYYTDVESVSRSGMSRIINIAIIKNNQLQHAPDFIYKLAGCDSNQRVSGCGMDMLFHCQYVLFRSLCPNHRYQDAMKRYNNL